VPLSRATTASNGKDQLYLAWIDLLVARNADSRAPRRRERRL
jgi:hypothetical protein